MNWLLYFVSVLCYFLILPRKTVATTNHLLGRSHLETECFCRQLSCRCRTSQDFPFSASLLPFYGYFSLKTSCYLSQDLLYRWYFSSLNYCLVYSNWLGFVTNLVVVRVGFHEEVKWASLLSLQPLRLRTLRRDRFDIFFLQSGTFWVEVSYVCNLIQLVWSSLARQCRV